MWRVDVLITVIATNDCTLRLRTTRHSCVYNGKYMFKNIEVSPCGPCGSQEGVEVVFPPNTT